MKPKKKTNRANRKDNRKFKLLTNRVSEKPGNYGACAKRSAKPDGRTLDAQDGKKEPFSSRKKNSPPVRGREKKGQVKKVQEKMERGKNRVSKVGVRSCSSGERSTHSTRPKETLEVSAS